jgi:hypothetical protein
MWNLERSWPSNGRHKIWKDNSICRLLLGYRWLLGSLGQKFELAYHHIATANRPKRMVGRISNYILLRGVQWSFDNGINSNKDLGEDE